MKDFLLLFVLGTMACTSSHYYIVRHAEKALVTSDPAIMIADNPPLSEAGKVRAFVLRNELQHKHIRHIYSTNTLRTISTARPLSQNKNIKIEIYNDLDSLVRLVKSGKGNTLIVGHSNTVDDIVNKLSGRKEILGDIKDKEYNNLFVITLKRGHYYFSKKKYGYPSNPE